MKGTSPPIPDWEKEDGREEHQDETIENHAEVRGEKQVKGNSPPIPDGEKDGREEHQDETVENHAEVRGGKQPKENSKKPKRPCFICGRLDSRLPRHILGQHADHEIVLPLRNLERKEQLQFFAEFRKVGIREYNMKVINEGGSSFMRERRKIDGSDSKPVMCSGCKVFFFKKLQVSPQ